MTIKRSILNALHSLVCAIYLVSENAKLVMNGLLWFSIPLDEESYKQINPSMTGLAFSNCSSCMVV